MTGAPAVTDLAALFGQQWPHIAATLKAAGNWDQVADPPSGDDEAGGQP
ncbi:MAG TPA: hypothetical protein VK453_25205 [Micromonosporaceae bacterium]|nr:hypothetical protein [Micromonosporaceae bacterium]